MWVYISTLWRTLSKKAYIKLINLTSVNSLIKITWKAKLINACIFFSIASRVRFGRKNKEKYIVVCMCVKLIIFLINHLACPCFLLHIRLVNRVERSAAQIGVASNWIRRFFLVRTPRKVRFSSKTFRYSEFANNQIYLTMPTLICPYTREISLSHSWFIYYKSIANILPLFFNIILLKFFFYFFIDILVLFFNIILLKFVFNFFCWAFLKSAWKKQTIDSLHKSTHYLKNLIPYKLFVSIWWIQHFSQ